MANVYVNTLAVPRKARNKRIYAGNSFTSINRTEMVSPISQPVNEFKYPYGGIVTWRTGLTFDISKAGRPINGYFYESAATEKTLSAAHATLNRIDVFYIDINSVIGVLEGTPSATPQKPSIDPATQYELSFVEIPAAATEPAGIYEDVIYNENVEWTGSQSGTTVDFDSTTDPKVGSKCAEITNISHGDTITFTNATTLNVADYTSVGFWIKLKSTDFDGNFIEAYFKKTGDPTGKLQVAQIDRQSLNWQFISFNTADFEIPNGIFDGFTLRWHNNGDTYTGFYIDYIKLQKGIELPVIDFNQVQSDWNATDTTRPEYIKNKPTIPAAQIQSDWNQTTNTEPDYIKNKPAIPAAYNLPTATGSTLGGVKIGSGLSIDGAGILSATPDTSIKVAIDFVDADLLEFVYNCPVALVFTSQESEGADATISPALNTNMAQYGKVTITAPGVGLIVLNGNTL